MWWILGVALGVFLVASLIVPWVNLFSINQLRDELMVLRTQLRRALALMEEKGISVPPEMTAAAKPSPWVKPVPVAAEPQMQKATVVANPAPTPTKPQRAKVSFEQRFGAHLPVWIGGVALALAGFFLVKYSIEMGLLSPFVRIVLGLIFGAGLLGAAHWVHGKPRFENGVRIAQSLAGAGVAALYVCMFAGTTLYHLFPSAVGFMGLAVVTATAVILSLRYGMATAILGLVGGLLTPALVGSHDPSAAVLFIYLYFVITGLMLVIRKRQWWGLAIATILGGFLWVCAWMMDSPLHGTDSFFLELFLLATAGTSIYLARDAYRETAPVANPWSVLAIGNYISMGGALLLMGAIATRSDFGVMEWGMFGLLSLGGIALARSDQQRYGFAPIMALAINAAMLVAWHPADSALHLAMLAIFGTLYVVSGFVLQTRSSKPLLWAALTGAASMGYYLIAYGIHRHDALLAELPAPWGILAMGLAALCTWILADAMKRVPDAHGEKQHVLAIYASLVTGFVALGLTIELPREFLSVVFAAQLCAVAWINTKVHIRALRHIAQVLALCFGVILLPQLLLLVQLTAYSLVEAKLALQDGIPLVNWPLFQLGLPAVFFAGASYLLRLKRDDRFVDALEIAGVALVGIMGYYLTRHAFHAGENLLFVKAGFIERGAITNVIYVYGLACLLGGRYWSRPALALSGLALAGVALFRIGFFDLIAYNPLWAAQEVGILPIANALLLPYGLPILWSWLVVTRLPAGQTRLRPYGYAAMGLLAFTLISMNVRQFFHGSFLNGGVISNGEIYSYSVAWLLFGIGLLFLGTLRHDKMIRIASLAVMILTVGKVFLYDASELEGLYRVFSFFGLGLSLLGLSWFYTRFVFNREGRV